MGPHSVGFGVSLPSELGGFPMAYASERLCVQLQEPGSCSPGAGLEGGRGQTPRAPLARARRLARRGTPEQARLRENARMNAERARSRKRRIWRRPERGKGSGAVGDMTRRRTWLISSSGSSGSGTRRARGPSRAGAGGPHVPRQLGRSAAQEHARFAKYELGTFGGSTQAYSCLQGVSFPHARGSSSIYRPWVLSTAV